MNKFNWLDDFRIGNDLIDQQHQHLFDLANQIFQTDDEATISHCAHELFRYIRVHFREEEVVMKECHFPHFQAHVASHDCILLELEDISTHMTATGISHEKLHLLMVDWLLNHILKEDMLIGEFLRDAMKG